jgi:hypothetical protein
MKSVIMEKFVSQNEDTQLLPGAAPRSKYLTVNRHYCFTFPVFSEYNE